jgi:hypothetical protein
MLQRLPRNLGDWNHERAREEVLQLRHQRWRSNTTHALKLARTVAFAWLLLRHGADLTDAILNIADTDPDLCR